MRIQTKGRKRSLARSHLIDGLGSLERLLLPDLEVEPLALQRHLDDVRFIDEPARIYKSQAAIGIVPKRSSRLTKSAIGLVVTR